MVVGIVIGAGIFFKGSKGLSFVGGEMKNCLIVIAFVGLIAIICSNLFAILARKYVNCIGFVDYADAAIGPRYSY